MLDATKPLACRKRPIFATPAALCAFAGTAGLLLSGCGSATGPRSADADSNPYRSRTPASARAEQPVNSGLAALTARDTAPTLLETEPVNEPVLANEAQIRQSAEMLDKYFTDLAMGRRPVAQPRTDLPADAAYTAAYETPRATASIDEGLRLVDARAAAPAARASTAASTTPTPVAIGADAVPNAGLSRLASAVPTPVAMTTPAATPAEAAVAVNSPSGPTSSTIQIESIGPGGSVAASTPVRTAPSPAGTGAAPTAQPTQPATIAARTTLGPVTSPAADDPAAFLPKIDSTLGTGTSLSLGPRPQPRTTPAPDASPKTASAAPTTPEPAATASAAPVTSATPDAIPTAVFANAPAVAAAERPLTPIERKEALVAELAGVLREIAGSGDGSFDEAIALAGLDILQPGELKELADSGVLLPHETQTLLAAHSFLAGLTAGGSTVTPDRAMDVLDTVREELNENAAMRVPTAALCTRVLGYGQYETFPTNDEGGYSFVAGRRQPVIVYVEVDRFGRKPEVGPDGVQRWEVALTQELQIYQESDDLLVMSRKPELDRSVSRNRVRDYYLINQTVIPDKLTIGRYQLKVVMRDMHKNAVAEAVIPFQIVAQTAMGQ